MAKRKSAETGIVKQRGAAGAAGGVGKYRVYTLEVFILAGRVARRKVIHRVPKLSRTIQIRGDQTLEYLHYAIFDAFDRHDEHLYEFQFGKVAMDGPKYGLEMAADFGDPDMAGLVDETTIDSLGLQPKQLFFYWFDFGDDWWHQIKVKAIEPVAKKGKYPAITGRVGKSPPQYPDLEYEMEDDEEGGEDEES